MPDAADIELLAKELNQRISPDAVVAAGFGCEQASVEVAPAHLRSVLLHLKNAVTHQYTFLASLHGCDYLPAAPRLGVHYELLNMRRVERVRVKTRVGVEDPRLPSVVDIFPTAEFQEREVYDMFGVVFEGHPDMRRILMPEDYAGHPQRRDFPLGGEPVIFTHNEPTSPGWYE